MNTRRIAPTYRVKNDRYAIMNAIALGKPFYTVNGTLTGSRHLDTTGELPERVAELVKENRHLWDYVVYSYDTPIAWHRPRYEVKVWNQYRGGLVSEERYGFWTVPEIKYSATTSRHQAIVREALYFETHIQDVPADWK